MFTIVRLCVKTSLYLICQKSFYIYITKLKISKISFYKIDLQLDFS